MQLYNKVKFARNYFTELITTFTIIHKKSPKKQKTNTKDQPDVMSNSTNAGVIEAPWRRTSLGVVMETRHLTRVKGTAPPLDFNFLLMSFTNFLSFNGLST